jgi:hypothetical protein
MLKAKTLKAAAALHYVNGSAGSCDILRLVNMVEMLAFGGDVRIRDGP